MGFKMIDYYETTILNGESVKETMNDLWEAFKAMSERLQSIQGKISETKYQDDKGIVCSLILPNGMTRVFAVPKEGSEVSYVDINYSFDDYPMKWKTMILEET